MSLSRNIARLLPNNNGRLPIQNSIIGNVIQAVHVQSENNWQTTSGSWVSSSIYGQITPQSINSKILVTIAGTVGSNTGAPGVTIGRNNNQIGPYAILHADYSWPNVNPGYCLQTLDAPNTLSQITYSLMLKASGNLVITNCNYGGNSYSTTTISLLEIAG